MPMAEIFPKAVTPTGSGIGFSVRQYQTSLHNCILTDLITGVVDYLSTSRAVMALTNEYKT